MEYIGHGGRCCGISHICSLGMNPNAPHDRTRNHRQQLQCLMDRNHAANTVNRALEVVLAGEQIEVWHGILLELGFRAIYSFRNSNSGNLCTVYIHYNNVRAADEPDYEELTVYNPDQQVPVHPAPPPPPPPVPAVVQPAYRVGDRVRLLNDNLDREGVVERITPEGVPVVRMDDTRVLRSSPMNRWELLPPARQELRVIETEYYASLRATGRRGPFTTALDARGHYPRCRLFERRDIMSDGTSVWTAHEDNE